jgi:hypothetical protein
MLFSGNEDSQCSCRRSPVLLPRLATQGLEPGNRCSPGYFSALGTSSGSPLLHCISVCRLVTFWPICKETGRCRGRSRYGEWPAVTSDTKSKSSDQVIQSHSLIGRVLAGTLRVYRISYSLQIDHFVMNSRRQPSAAPAKFGLRQVPKSKELLGSRTCPCQFPLVAQLERAMDF